MKVVITGGTGFIGQRLAQRLVALGSLTGPDGSRHPIDSIVLFDALEPTAPIAGVGAETTVVTGDISDRATVTGLIDRDDIAVFHLASVVSAGAEQDFDLGMRVNINGGINVMEAVRHRAGLQRVVFTSSIAVYGGPDLPATVSDTTKQVPQTTYGMTKAVCELLLNDYTRKGFFDGRTARLPTVAVRPGKPNKAASSFVSGIIREPLNGIDCVLPVAPETSMPILGYRNIVEGLIALHEADGDAIGADRGVSLPSITVTMTEMMASLRRVAGNRHLGAITVQPDPFIEDIVAGWAADSDWRKAKALGLPVDPDMDAIVQAYMEDYLAPDA